MSKESDYGFDPGAPETIYFAPVPAESTGGLSEAEREMWHGLNALRLEVHGSIADDVVRLVRNALATRDAEHARHEAAEVARVRAETWPCANYTAPVTCLTAPGTEAGRCDWCVTQVDRVRAEKRIKTLQEAADDWNAGAGLLPDTWLRRRAAALAREADGEAGR